MGVSPTKCAPQTRNLLVCDFWICKEHRAMLDTVRAKDDRVQNMYKKRNLLRNGSPFVVMCVKSDDDAGSKFFLIQAIRSSANKVGPDFQK